MAHDHEPCCPEHATGHLTSNMLQMLFEQHTLIMERLNIMSDTQDKILADLTTVKEQQGRLIGFVETFRTQLADLKATIQQQQLDATAEKKILDAVDQIRDDSAAELAKIAADNAGTTPTPQPAATVTQFAIKPVNPTVSPVADAPFAFDLAATDITGAPVPSYTGTAHFTSDVGGQSVPNDDYTFVPADNGVHAFQATFPAGTHTITVTEAGNPAIIGTMTVVVS